MNFLGHSYFSNENDKIITGNVMGDTYKGRVELMNFPDDIKKGITLHRTLDKVGDELEAFKNSRLYLKEYRLYSGALVDIFNDHFLAKHWLKYHQLPLSEFSQQIYKSIEKNKEFLTDDGKNLLYYMSKGDWLYNYRNLETIEDVLFRMAKRNPRRELLKKSIENLKKDYNSFEENFFIFMEEMNKRFKK